MKNNKANPKIKWLKLVGSILFYIIIIFVIAFGIIGVVGRAKGKVGGIGFFGYNAYVVVSPSMAAVHPSHFRKDDIKALGKTQFAKGELVIVKNLTDNDEIKDLDVVTFANSSGYIIIHRVVNIQNGANGEKIYTTQGDANNSADGDRMRDQILGIKVASLGKFAGTIVMFMQSGWGIAAVAITIAIILIATLVADDGKKKQPKPIEPPDEEEDKNLNEEEDSLADEEAEGNSFSSEIEIVSSEEPASVESEPEESASGEGVEIDTTP